MERDRSLTWNIAEVVISRYFGFFENLLERWTGVDPTISIWVRFLLKLIMTIRSRLQFLFAGGKGDKMGEVGGVGNRANISR